MIGWLVVGFVLVAVALGLALVGVVLRLCLALIGAVFGLAGTVLGLAAAGAVCLILVPVAVLLFAPLWLPVAFLVATAWLVSRAFGHRRQAVPAR